LSLETVQKEFIGYLYSPKPTEDQQALVRSYFFDPASPDPYGGLTIYRRNLVFGIIRAMRETYGFCLALLGEKNFHFLCREYLYGHPSYDSDLIQYGGDFAQFLGGREELRDLSFIPDVAGLEWALERAFYAPPARGSALKPSVRLVRTRYHVHEAWKSFQERGVEGIDREQFRSGEERLAVWAQDGTPRVMPLDEKTAAWLEKAIGTPSKLEQGAVLEFAVRQGWFERP
jgi:hypothetical protein